MQKAELKAQERIQLIKRHKAMAALQTITTYNDLNNINRPGLTEDKVLTYCISSLGCALRHLQFALKLYKSETTPELKVAISTHFERMRQETLYLQCVLPICKKADSNEG